MWNVRLFGQGRLKKVRDTPQSWLQPAETDHPHMDPGLCVHEPSGTVDSLKQKIGNIWLQVKGEEKREEYSLFPISDKYEKRTK